MRDAIIDHLVAKGVATEEQAAQARALLELGDGCLVSLLCEVGFPRTTSCRRRARSAACRGAPQHLLDAARAPPVDGLDLSRFRALGAVPFAVHDAQLCVAFFDPEIALGPKARALPMHLPFLALENEVRRALSAMLDPPTEAIERPSVVNPPQKGR